MLAAVNCANSQAVGGVILNLSWIKLSAIKDLTSHPDIRVRYTKNTVPDKTTGSYPDILAGLVDNNPRDTLTFPTTTPQTRKKI